MNGDFESGGPLVPSELTKYSHQGYTSLLIEYLLGNDVDESTILENLKNQNKETKMRIFRLYCSQGHIETFLKKIKERLNQDEQQTIKEALALMLKLHIDQSDRADGSGPYITHPIKVALGVLGSYKGDHLADTVVGALLHDSVEDQSNLLQLLHITEETGEIDTNSSKYSINSDALSGLEEKFGPDVAELVRMLSFGIDVDNKDFSEDDYINYVRSIVKNTENHGPEAFVIKWQDARENMLKVGNLWRRSRHLIEVAHTTQPARAKELKSNAQKAEHLYRKLRDKYKPVLADVFLPAFKNMDESHVLFSLRTKAIKEINTALKEEYDLDKQE